ncbi:MAG: hypothetical protein EOM59_12115 [Clostridia bacterium]|nr:hypothetical protein [Clostridia bacterium]
MKKISTFTILFAILFMVACKGSGSVEIPEEQIGNIDESYALLEEAVSTFGVLSSGTLEMSMRYEQKHIDVSGQGESLYENEQTKTVHFAKAGAGYNFIEIVETNEQDVPIGYKQEDGVYTQYNYMAYDEGTFQWMEGAAELANDALPEEFLIIMQLMDKNLVDEILIKEEGDYIKYTLVLDEIFFDRAHQSSDLAGYALSGYVLNYFVDQDNSLSRVSLDKSESWIQSENYNVEQRIVYDISLIEKNQAVDLNFFETSGTYTRPVYDEITEIWREEFINIPETYIFDVRVPKMKESLPNAEKINQKIAVDCTVALNSTVDDLLSEGGWGGYPWHTVDFSVYQFGDIYQICIFNTEASAWGSGIGMWMYKYYYDIALGDVVNQEDFLVMMNYTPEEIVEIFHRDYLGQTNMEETYTYDEIAEWYYFDQDAKIQFYINLFG